MFRPFKKLETAWNARTPVWLHNRTKENIIFQLLLTAVGVLGVVAKAKYDDRQFRKLAKAHYPYSR